MSIKSLRRLAVPSAVEFEDPIWSGEVRDHQSAEAGTAGTATEHHERGLSDRQPATPNLIADHHFRYENAVNSGCSFFSELVQKLNWVHFEFRL